MVYLMILMGLFLILPMEAEEKRSYLFILDASGSMNERMNGTTRMEVATKELQTFIQSLPEETELGLVAYGNRIPGCNSARLYAPLKRNNKKEILAKLPLFYPAGSTPIAKTLELVSQHLLHPNQKTEIILISDGMESCEGEPSLEIKKIQKKYPGTILHVLALDVPKNEEPELQTLASVGGGKYYNIRNHQSFRVALQSIQGNVEEPILFSDLANPQQDQSKKNLNPTIPYIKILNIELIREENSTKEYKIHYEYKAQPNLTPGEYSTLVVFSPEPTNPSLISQESIPNRFPYLDRVAFSRSVAHSQSEGTGYLWVQLRGSGSWVVSCELWNMESIPKPMAICPIKNLKEGKKTENFPGIFR